MTRAGWLRILSQTRRFVSCTHHYRLVPEEWKPAAAMHTWTTDFERAFGRAHPLPLSTRAKRRMGTDLGNRIWRSAESPETLVAVSPCFSAGSPARPARRSPRVRAACAPPRRRISVRNQLESRSGSQGRGLEKQERPVSGAAEVREPDAGGAAGVCHATRWSASLHASLRKQTPTRDWRRLSEILRRPAPGIRSSLHR